MSTPTQYMPASATAGFDPSLVTADVKFNWCQAQTQSCPEICYGDTTTNICYSDLLTFYCVCKNGTTPDCSRFIQTLPFFICEATYDQCTNGTDSAVQQKCKSNAICGYEDPASAAQAAIPAGSSVSIGTTTVVGTAGANMHTQTALVPTSSAGLIADNGPSISAAAAAGLGVGCTVAAMLAAGLLIFFIRRRRRTKSGVANVNVHQIASHSSSHGAGDMGYTKPELSAASTRHELDGVKTSVSASGGWVSTSRSGENSSE